ncbi:MAG TPA: isoprenylcysteine carboxylmethyltransferase family protein [Candidatus Sulfotelmatobacter sp.]|jgi:protein-S-isoprenylcysteine O-methyltransferase Ste14|nr:isoprenylcysteine carboxylmethyltransferase family protein [Candidatus Sulfotelmatobacter sp.]
MTPLDFFARQRVRIGYLLAVVVLFLSRPEPLPILIGACVGLLGLAIRAYAAGYLHKQSVLTTTGPYSRTRNPLYFGSSILALGAAIAMNSWFSAALLLFYFALVYRLVMHREEIELRGHHGAEFDAYAKSVPLFFPRLTAPEQPPATAATFSWSQYRQNHEYQAALGFLLLLLALVVIWRLHTA